MPQQALNDRFKALQAKKDDLLRSVAKLESDQQDLLLEHCVGQQWAADLVFLLEQQHAGGGALPDVGTHAVASRGGSASANHQCEQQQDEVAAHNLLAQLRRQPDSEAGGVQSGLALLLHPQPGVDTVAPAGDPQAFIRALFALPMQPGATSMTTQQLVAMQKDIVSEAMLQSQALQCEPPEQQAQAWQQLAEAWIRFYHTLISMYRAGLAKEAYEMVPYNMATMEIDPEGAMAKASRVGAMMEQLVPGLSQQQRAIIVAGMRVCQRQLDAILAERQALQAQQQPGAAGGGLPVSSSSGSGSSNSGSSSGTHVGGGLAAADNRRALLAAEEARGDRLQRLLRKEHNMRLMGVGWVLGCLTWPQVFRISGMWWPYTPRWLLVGQAVLEASST